MAEKVKAGGAPTYTPPATLRLLLTSHIFVLTYFILQSLPAHTVNLVFQRPWSNRPNSIVTLLTTIVIVMSINGSRGFEAPGRLSSVCL